MRRAIKFITIESFLLAITIGWLGFAFGTLRHALSGVPLTVAAPAGRSLEAASGVAAGVSPE